MTALGKTREAPQPRRAVRALLREPDTGAVLLLQMQFPGWTAPHWIAPGGGIEPGEARDAALCREIEEETGHRLPSTAAIGALVWTREVVFEWRDVWYAQREWYHLVEVPRFEPRLDENPDAHEVASLRAARWWTPQEMRRSAERFLPRAFADALERIDPGAAEVTPIDVGA